MEANIAVNICSEVSLLHCSISCQVYMLGVAYNWT